MQQYPDSGLPPQGRQGNRQGENCDPGQHRAFV